MSRAPNGSESTPRPRRIFITVAEVSGDRHAAQFIRSLREIDPTIEVEGVGGPEMAAAGAVVHRDTVTDAAMGWRGALRAGEIYRILRWTRRRFDDRRPDLWVGVDSPSMNFHFARAAHDRSIPTLQYVAPQLWAWREGRMEKLRRWVDQMACILPFEEAYFREHGVNATFVGHPLFDELPPNRGGRGADGAGGLPTRAPIIGLLPGSRRSIAQANFPMLLGSAALIRDAFPDATFLVPTTPATHPVVEKAAADAGWQNLEFPPTGAAAAPPAGAFFSGLNQFDEMVTCCDLCLTVSGTATLHVAGLGAPMIVVYRGNPLLWNLLGRWLIKARTYALVNLLAAKTPARADPARHVVPEFVPWYGSPAGVANLAIDYLHHPEKLAEQRRRLSELIHALNHPGASANVARMALKMIGDKSGGALAAPAKMVVAAGI